MRYELSDDEWTAIKPMLPNKPRGVARPASMAQRRRCEGVLDMAPTMPIVKQAGIDPVYFGVLFIINNAIGLVTSPVGVVLNVSAACRASAWRISSRASGPS